MNLFMLVLKGITLMYSKFVVSLLVSVLIMPQDRFNSEVLDDDDENVSGEINNDADEMVEVENVEEDD